MNPNARISALESKLNALTLIIEKQNETQAQEKKDLDRLSELSISHARETTETFLNHQEVITRLEKRITALEARLPAPPSETTYKPLFDRWPGNAR